MNKLLNYLDSIRPLSQNLRLHLEATLKHCRVSRKEYLLRANQVSKKICFIEKGLLRCYYIRFDQEISSWFMLENDVAISVESFFCQSTSKEYIQALEETDLWYITYEELQDTYSKFPEFNLIGRIITENYYVLSEQRSACMRQQRAPERYRFLLENYPTLIQRVPSKYLASYLGITEVTLSIIKSKKLAY